jgi:threonine/homoserine/homoserine lactone efflux protein
MSHSAVIGFAAVSLAVIVVPGPSVMFAISRALVAGRGNALLAVLGNASGVFSQVVFIAFGIGVIVTGSDLAYALLKVVGAAYLVWLGMDAIRHRHEAVRATSPAGSPASTRPWRDGFVVGITNPKSVVFLAALLPRYVEPAEGPPAFQMIALGALFCGIALVSDGVWALLAARARRWFAGDPRRLAWTSVAGGLTMMALGLLLLFG